MNQELFNKLIAARRRGLSHTAAARECGIEPDRLLAWLHRGACADGSLLWQFRAEWKRAGQEYNQAARETATR